VLVCFRPFAPDGAGTPRVKLRKTPKKDESVLSFSPSEERYANSLLEGKGNTARSINN
jgi:hypothetical protein